MDAKADPLQNLLIADVERETGLARATLRIWERRYGFPLPGRDERGERTYSAAQVEMLRAMKELVDLGHRPGDLARAGEAGILALAAQARPAPGPVPRNRPGARMLRLLQSHDAIAVRAELDALLARDGLAEFAGRHLPHMNRLVGQAWAAGELQVHEEHLYSDCIAQVMRVAIERLGKSTRPEAPQVLLTTLQQESHGLGLLMAHAMFALQGCPTVSLGVRLPVEQVDAAVRAWRADLVGLTFTSTMNPGHVLRGLQELRGSLPPRVRIWAGGDSPALQRRSIAGVRVVNDVLAIPELLAEDFALPPVER